MEDSRKAFSKRKKGNYWIIWWVWICGKQLKGIVKECEKKEQLVIKNNNSKANKKGKTKLGYSRNDHRIKLLSPAVNNIYMLIIYKHRILIQ